MMKTMISLLALVAATAALAQKIPDEATKKKALLRAYHLNGDKMARWGSIDLSHDDLDDVPHVVKTIPIPPPKAELPKLDATSTKSKNR